MKKVFQKLFIFFSQSKLTFVDFLVSFGALLILNLLFQFLTYGFHTVSFEYLLGIVLQMYYPLLFFSLVIFLYFLLRPHFTTKEKIWQHVFILVLWGFWGIVFWPLIDKLILGNSFYLSYYLYGGAAELGRAFITFFGPLKPVGILYGTRIEMALIILFLSGYIYFLTRSWWKGMLAGLGVYILFFLSVAWPSLIVLLKSWLSGQDLAKVNDLTVVKFFNTPLYFFGQERRIMTVAFFYKISLFYNLILLTLLFWWQWLSAKKRLLALLKNIRWPQMIFNWGLFGLGIGLAWLSFPSNFSWTIWNVLVVLNLLLAILFVWLFAVIINDLSDQSIDQLSNRQRPLITGQITERTYLLYGISFLILAAFFSLAVSGKIFSLLVVYVFLTLIYSRPPFRLKAWPIISGLVAAAASILLLFSGYILISPKQELTAMPWRFVFFLLLAYGLILPIKDIKDIVADRQQGVLTIANLLGEKAARVYFGIIIFSAYLFSVLIIRLPILFFPAMLAGLISFFIVINPKNRRNKLLFKLLGVIVAYLLIIVGLIYFN